MKLARLLLPPDKLQSILDDQTRLSRAYGASPNNPDDPLRLLDLLPDQYPAFLFHHAPEEFARDWREHYADDYVDSLYQLVFRPPRNLGARLRAFRLTHDLTLRDAAYLLDISKAQLHCLERRERNASPRTAFRILRLLTAPLGPGAVPRATRRRPRVQGRSEGKKARAGKQRDERQECLDRVKLLLTLPPPPPGAGGDPDRLDLLRSIWFAHEGSSKELAEELEITPRHLRLLLCGDRRPGRALRERIVDLAATLPGYTED